MTQGLWISFEGIDGAGKSTHIESLAKTFESQGRTITLTREPGGTALAETLRELMLGTEMDPLSESLLAFAARRDHLYRVIIPALNQGHVVLCDRFTDATFAYQGGGRGVPLEVLVHLEQWVQARSAPELTTKNPSDFNSAPLLESMAPTPNGLWQPDLTLWFDLSPEVAAKRLLDARTPDRFESQSVAFFERVQRAYAHRLELEPKRFLKIDASLTRHEVWQQITRGLTAKGWLSIMVPTPHMER
jgi:dTMP kinase